MNKKLDLDEKLRCKWCDKPLGLRNVEVFIGEVICRDSRCRGSTLVKIKSDNPYIVHKELLPKNKKVV